VPARRRTRGIAIAALVAATTIVLYLAISMITGSGSDQSTAAAAADRGAAKPGSDRHAKRPVTLEWVGDMAMSSALGLPPGGVYHAVSPMARTLHRSDLTIGNLEGTLSVGGASKCGGPSGGTCFAFQAPPSTAFALRRLGFDLVNQANNHAQDFGPSGHAQTIAALRRAKVAWTGDPGQITYLTTHGVRVAFLGFAPYGYTSNLLDIPRAKAMVRTAARHAALVVVIIHAGAEGADQLHTPRGTQYYLSENRGNARLFAHSVIRAGASVVFGSGPHVIRGVQAFHGHLIAYSLGNFIGYRTLGGGGVLNDSGVIRVSLNPANGRVIAARWIPVTLDDGLPRLAAGDGDAPLVARLSREDFPSSHFEIRPNGVFAPSRGHGRAGVIINGGS
jgi:poly-gamma-glutamate capsule biosynthesis protein CapA/YwtB (metallophosphatase superfamily)